MALLYSSLAALIVGVVLWFSGDYHGHSRGVAEIKAEDQKAFNLEIAKRLKEEKDYAKQITDANATRDEALSRLAVALAAPHPHILCHAAAPGGSPVSSVPEKGSDQGTGPNPTTDVRGSDFDPSTNLSKLHYAFAVSYLACIDQVNRWPN